MTKEAWDNRDYAFQYSNIGGEFIREARKFHQGRSMDIDPKVLELVQRLYEWTINNPENKERVEELKEAYELSIDFFRDNSRKLSLEELTEMWNKYLHENV